MGHAKIISTKICHYVNVQRILNRIYDDGKRKEISVYFEGMTEFQRIYYGRSILFSLQAALGGQNDLLEWFPKMHGNVNDNTASRIEMRK